MRACDVKKRKFYKLTKARVLWHYETGGGRLEIPRSIMRARPRTPLDSLFTQFFCKILVP
jgi:hypothetical protein